MSINETMIERKETCMSCENKFTKHNLDACILCGCIIDSMTEKEYDIDENGNAFKISQDKIIYICRAKKW